MKRPRRRRNDRITIERGTPIRDAFGGKEERVWALLTPAWAEVTYGTGAERRIAAQESASVSATFRVHRTSETTSVGPADRIQFGAGTWDIKSAVPYGREDIDITTVKPA